MQISIGKKVTNALVKVTVLLKNITDNKLYLPKVKTLRATSLWDKEILVIHSNQLVGKKKVD